MTLKSRPICRFLQDVLHLESRGKYQYQSTITWMPTEKHVAGFGGDTVAQGLEACRRTLDNNVNLHSMHCYFVRPRLPEPPVLYNVSILRDGKAFKSRTVNAIQNGKAIFSLQASFHDEEGEAAPESLAWHPEMQSVIKPDGLETLAQSVQRIRETSLSNVELKKQNLTYFSNIHQDLSVDMKLVNAEATLLAGQGASKADLIWIRMKENLGSDQNIHRSAVAYCSDIQMMLGHSKQFPAKTMGGIPSLDHSMWFHRNINMNDWNLLETSSRTWSNSRGLTDGYLWNQSGQLVASMVQEGLVRVKL